MVYPPGQGKSGEYLMALWRRYLQKYAEAEGHAEEQTLAASDNAAEIFGFLSESLDQLGHYRELIEQRRALHEEGVGLGGGFEDRLLNATFAIYSHLNTLAQQFVEGNPEPRRLVQSLDEQLQSTIGSGAPMDRSAAAVRSSFALLSLLTLVLNQDGQATATIRRVEVRFSSGARLAVSAADQLLNALYRTVEMMQLFVALSDGELLDQVGQIAARFEEEDRAKNPGLKMRNGFCRLFELGHLLATHLDEVVT